MGCITLYGHMTSILKTGHRSYIYRIEFTAKCCHLVGNRKPFNYAYLYHDSKIIYEEWFIFLHKMGFNCGTVLLKDWLDLQKILPLSYVSPA